MGPRPRRGVWAAVKDQEPSGSRSRNRPTHRRSEEVPTFNLCCCSERATVVTDVVLILPLMLMMIAGMFMLGTRISDYMYLQQSTRELGMILSKIPYMYELGHSPVEYRTFSIDPKEVDMQGAKATAENCITAFSNPDPKYQGCTTSGGDCACARHVAYWYAIEFMRMKLLLVEWPIEVKVGYTSRPGDTSSGLCFIDVETRASHHKWAMVGGGEVATEAHVPYVSYPVPWNNGACYAP